MTQLQNSVQTNFIIRGFGNGANNAGIEPSVGVFIDGVYRSRSAGALSDLPNLQRVEVLRGPQSTLFGKNASAGVISVVTEKPSFDTEGYVEGTIGNYDLRALKGYFSTGIADNMAVSIGGSVNKRDGYYDNLVTGVAQNDRDRWGLRGQVLYEPTDDVSLRVIADIDKIEEICCGVGNILAGPTADIITGGGILPLIGLPVSQQGGLGENLVPNDLYAYEGFYDFDPINEVDNRGISLHADIDINENMTLKSITSYREQDILFDGDVDFTGARLVEQNIQETESGTFTQELRLEASSGDLDWQVGAFYFEEDLTTDTFISYGDQFRAFGDYNVYLLQAQSGVPNGLGVPLNFLQAINRIVQQDPTLTFFGTGQGLGVGFNQDNSSLSLFGQGDYQVSDRLTATVGVSYVEDRKTVTSNSFNTDSFSQLNLTGSAFESLQALQFLPPFQDFPNDVEDNKTRDNKFTYTVRLAYDLKDNINVYGSVSTGFKASVWNLSRDSRPTPEDYQELVARGLDVVNLTSGSRFAGPEESTVYELGVKAKLDKGYVNVTVFDQTIEGFQSNSFTGTGFILANAGEQSSKGIEVDLFYRPVDGLSISASGTFLDPLYDSFVGGLGPQGPADLSGERPGGIHEFSGVFAATYDFDLMDRDAYVRGDVLFESDVQVVDAIDKATVGDDANREVMTFNASAGVSLTDQLDLQLWARNLFNDEYPLSIFPSVAQAGSFSGYPNAPRTFGGSLRFSFD